MVTFLYWANYYYYSIKKIIIIIFYMVAKIKRIKNSDFFFLSDWETKNFGLGKNKEDVLDFK